MVLRLSEGCEVFDEITQFAGSECCCQAFWHGTGSAFPSGDVSQGDLSDHQRALVGRGFNGEESLRLALDGTANLGSVLKG